MPGNIEYIESYFDQALSNEERAAFETRCETDETFAQDVAFYIAARQALREELIGQKVGEWKNGEMAQAPVIALAKKRITFGGWVAYAAAACVLLAVSVYLFEAQTSPQKLASGYIKANYEDLSHTMDASYDSIQAGIEAYNHQDYNKALQLFEGVEQTDMSNSDAKKYAGLAYLQKKDYDKAIEQFDGLANQQGLMSNPGDFLKATALLIRNEQGDREAAKVLLQKVVQGEEEGSKEAEEWLKKF